MSTSESDFAADTVTVAIDVCGLSAFVEISHADVRADTLVFAPCIPASWPGFDLTLRYRGAVYEISVHNPARVSRGVVAALLDGASQLIADGNALLPLSADQGTHQILITLG